MAVTYSQNGVIVKSRQALEQAAYLPAQQNTLIVDKNGYIGDKKPAAGNTYFCYVDPDADFSQSQLGQVTLIIPEIGETVIGGRKYRTTRILNQTWLAENLDLKITGYTPGVWNDSDISFGYWGDDERQYGIDGTYKCGLLYNGHAVDYLESSKSTLFPGWHIPTRSEYEVLNSLQSLYHRAVDGSITSGFPLNWNGTNSSMLNIIPCGTRYNGSYGYFGTNCDLWSSTNSASGAKYGLEFTSSSAVIYSSFYYKNGYSVRLIKDSE